MRKTLIVIPARLNSTRVPRKILQDIHGKPLIREVWERTKVAADEMGADLVVAVDSEEVRDVVDDFGVSLMTHDRKNGTERCADVCEAFGYTNGTFVINVQGDNAGLDPRAVISLRDSMIYGPESIRTLYCMNENLSQEELLDESIIKVVVNDRSEGVWFTRKPIPLSRKHSGIYGYTSAFLNTYLGWGEGRFERYEKLEQMRVIENGGKIQCMDLNFPSGMAVNTLEDLELIRSRPPSKEYMENWDRIFKRSSKPGNTTKSSIPLPSTDPTTTKEPSTTH